MVPYSAGFYSKTYRLAAVEPIHRNPHLTFPAIETVGLYSNRDQEDKIVDVPFAFLRSYGSDRWRQIMYDNKIAAAFRRHRAIELMRIGESKNTISRILGVSKTSLYLWERKASAGENLKTKSPGGRPRRMNDRQLYELEELLKKGAKAHGWRNNLWTTARIRLVIKRHFGIKFCRSQVWHILHDYLNWSAIRPAKQAAKRDESEISRWKADEFPRIEREARDRNAFLAFIDESGFMMAPTIRRTFAPRGSTPVNKINDPHGRISVSGTIVISPKRTLVDFHYYMLCDNTNFRGPTVIDCLKHLRRQIRGPITIIWDQIIIHSSKVVLEYLQTAKDIIIESFPPYAPELNPVDRVWFYLKYDRFPNYTPSTIARLRRSVESELKRLQRQPELLLSFIRQSGVPLVFEPDN
jgi:transposase